MANAKEYSVFGDYGFVHETELFNSTDLNESIRFFDRYWPRENAGGFNILEVAWFRDCGEYVTERRWARED